ncbi:hypothetical protein [Mesorhizobium sp. AA22]|uniref:hypothetical protein n=1 Tax=Mesorhizobium sp. AA22 TaxID=1854057 RepID=UPI001FEE1467|nr:hypothetical protein [Mesorhizobium sp. AA22]
MPTSNNPPFPAALRLFSGVVIIVLIVGAGLFFAPVLVKPRWLWAVTPFNARFLGGFYTTEMVVMAALVVWNRWSPGRLVLVMAFIFTVIVSVVSFISAISTSGAKRPGSGFWSILLRSRYPGCSCGGPGPVLLQKA